MPLVFELLNDLQGYFGIGFGNLIQRGYVGDGCSVIMFWRRRVQIVL
jgi:hypothetical protein